MSRAADLDRTLAALADPARRRVLEALRRRPQTAGDLADKVGMSPAALSRHLRTLKAAGLVEEAHPAALKAWLTQTEDLWARQLVAFRQHLEERR